MITKSTLFHTAKSADSYAYDNQTLHLRLRTARNEVIGVHLWIGDPYLWAEGGLDGGNLAGSDAHGWIGGQRVEMCLEGSTQYYDHWFAEFKPVKKRCRYGFILHGKDNETLFFGEQSVVDVTDPMIYERELSNFNNLFCYPYINPVDVLNIPEWVKNTVWYQIFPERFCNGRPEISPPGVEPWGSEPTSSNFMGGDLWGVIEKLDYLEDLGITGLYFCPVFTANANHKYDTVDYYSVDPAFGGNEALKVLVSEAHRRGMKVMLDVVFNHIGNQSPLWLDVVQNGAQSKYADWFWIHKFPVYPDTPQEEWDRWNFNYETFGNVIEMPKLKTENDQCRKYLLDVVRYWMTTFDIDAWRLDVANEVDHVFWRDFRRTVKGIKSESYIIGEVWHDGMPWLHGDQFDSVMNYPLSQKIIDYFAFNTLAKGNFIDSINKTFMTYPRNVCEGMFNILDSHDTSRILSSCNGNKDKAKLAYLFMFALPGTPCIYYGSEIGMDGHKAMFHEGNRKCMIWDEDKQDLEMKSFLKTLIKLWRNTNTERIFSVRWLSIDDEGCIGWLLGSISVIVNNTAEEKVIYYKGDRFLLQPYGYSLV